MANPALTSKRPEKATRRQRRLRRLKGSLPAALVMRFVELDILTQAASLAFYALLSLAPLLVLLLWLTASLYAPAQEAIVGQVGQIAGREAASVADTVIRNADARPQIGSIAGIWSTLLLFVGATAVFARLQEALNLIFRTDKARIDGVMAWMRKRILSFGVVLALGFLLIVAVAVNTLLQMIFSGMPSLLPTLGQLATYALYALAFTLLYHFLPDRRVSWRQALLGGAITAALFVLGRWLIGMYLIRAAPGSAYGSMGALVLLVVWMYYAAAVFFFGALVTAVMDERAKARRIAAANADVSQAPLAQAKHAD